MKKLIIILVISIKFISCGPRIEITREYVTSSKWGKANTFECKANVSIEKIIFKKPIEVFSKNFKKKNIPDDYVIDSSFCYKKYYTNNWEINIIYFDREQKDITWRKCSDFTNKYKIIGKLELNTWYKMYNIRYGYIYYVYVDIKGKTHVFEFRTRGLFV